MKKRKIIGVSIISVIVILVGGVIFSFNNMNPASATIAIFEGQPYQITFKKAIKQSSIKDGSIYVQDEQGKKVAATFALANDRKTLIVSNLPIGKYKVVVDKSSFGKKSILIKNRQIDVQVLDKVTNIASKEALQAYFNTILQTQQMATPTFTMNEQESAVMEDSGSSMENAVPSKDSHSTTNNQVDGIEEGDIVVTDGENIYMLKENVVKILQAKDVKNMKELSTITFSDQSYPVNLMVHDDVLIVIYSSHVERKDVEYYDGKTITKAAFYNVQDGSNPKLIREIGQDGYITGSRKKGDTFYLVTGHTPNYWIMNEDKDVQLQPEVYSNNTSELLPLDRIHVLPENPQPHYLVVSALDLSSLETAAVNTQSYLGDSGTMYMSDNAIYIAAMNYMYWPMFMMEPIVEEPILEDAIIDVVTDDAARTTVWAPPPAQENKTTIYKIAINKTSIEMAAKGEVKGHILNQYSMDEHNGHFRVATTNQGQWWANNDSNSNNTLHILDNNLVEVGKLDNLARGEQIYSTRFMGDKVYIVTFEQVDPLFVIDASNPTNPKVLGELKIPGFSNYLHPLGENHLIGIGYDTRVEIDPYTKQPIVRTGGMKISLFNVSDVSNPIEQDNVIIGGSGTYSPVQYDAKALFRDVAKGYYGFPVSIYEDDPATQWGTKYKGSGSQIYNISTSGIELVADLVTPAAAGEQYDDWYKNIQRLMYIDETLYTVAVGEVKSYDLNTFEQTSYLKLQ